jgi:hypothetical protein
MTGGSAKMRRMRRGVRSKRIRMRMRMKMRSLGRGVGTPDE